MKFIIAYFENGDTVSTSVNGTEKEISDYYVGKMFNLGVVADNMQKCTHIEFQ